MDTYHLLLALTNIFMSNKRWTLTRHRYLASLACGNGLELIWELGV